MSKTKTADFNAQSQSLHKDTTGVVLYLVSIIIKNIIFALP